MVCVSCTYKNSVCYLKIKSCYMLPEHTKKSYMLPEHKDMAHGTYVHEHKKMVYVMCTQNCTCYLPLSPFPGQCIIWAGFTPQPAVSYAHCIKKGVLVKKELHRNCLKNNKPKEAENVMMLWYVDTSDVICGKLI